MQSRASQTLEDHTRKVDSAVGMVQNPCNDVRNGQFICQDCHTLSFCMQQNGAWTTLKISECETQHNLYCDEKARGCVFRQNCKENARNPKFECQNPGVFPDPYDCKYYHICNENNVVERRICPLGLAYSPASKTCSLTTNTNICWQPQYKCNAFGEMAAWPTDPNIYYVCHAKSVAGGTIRYPLMYRCQWGYRFANNRCVPHTTPKIRPKPAPTAVAVMKTCKSGSGLTSHPSDCYSYFVCRNKILVAIRCPVNTHFNPRTKSCVLGKC